MLMNSLTTIKTISITEFANLVKQKRIKAQNRTKKFQFYS